MGEAFLEYLEQAQVPTHYLQVTAPMQGPRRRRDLNGISPLRRERIESDYEFDYDAECWATRDGRYLLPEWHVWIAILSLLCHTDCRDEVVLLMHLEEFLEGIVIQDVIKALKIFKLFDLDSRADVRRTISEVQSIEGMSQKHNAMRWPLLILTSD